MFKFTMVIIVSINRIKREEVDDGVDSRVEKSWEGR